MRILIVGAGIGGLTAALALLRDGHDVEVYEQAEQLAELGAGVQISANGARVLFALGLERRHPRQVWCEPAGKEIRLWNTGETWKLFDLGAESVARYGAPYFMMHRADLHSVLIEARARAEARRDPARCACDGFDDDGDRVTLHLADGERVTGDVLIGADGVHSRIRNILAGDDKAEFTGCMAWRGLVPVEQAARAHAAQCRGELGRPRRTRHQLFPAPRRDLQLRRHRGARLARGILDRAGHARGMRVGFPRLERRHPRHHPQHSNSRTNGRCSAARR